jgi:hypothetical protein
VGRRGPHLHRDWAHPSLICTQSDTQTGLTPLTSAPDPGLPLPHLHCDWAHPTYKARTNHTRAQGRVRTPAQIKRASELPDTETPENGMVGASVRPHAATSHAALRIALCCTARVIWRVVRRMCMMLFYNANSAYDAYLQCY